MPRVVLPLTRVKVTRRVAVFKTDVISGLFKGNTGYNSEVVHTSYIPSHSPSLPVVHHPVSFVPRGLILIIIGRTLTQTRPIKTEASKSLKTLPVFYLTKKMSGSYLSMPFALIPLPCI